VIQVWSGELSKVLRVLHSVTVSQVWSGESCKKLRVLHSVTVSQVWSGESCKKLRVLHSVTVSQVWSDESCKKLRVLHSVTVSHVWSGESSNELRFIRGFPGCDVYHNTTQRHNPEDLDLKYHHHESLKILINIYMFIVRHALAFNTESRNSFRMCPG
jgi:hypothetical protein